MAPIAWTDGLVAVIWLVVIIGGIGIIILAALVCPDPEMHQRPAGAGGTREPSDGEVCSRHGVDAADCAHRHREP